MNRVLLFLALLASSVPASAAIIEVTWRYPTGRKIEWSRIEYGTCKGKNFGALQSWQVLPVSIQMTHFTQVPSKTACTRAIWIATDGQRYTSNVVKVTP